jgi:hypothetical protein
MRPGRRRPICSYNRGCNSKSQSQAPNSLRFTIFIYNIFTTYTLQLTLNTYKLQVTTYNLQLTTYNLQLTFWVTCGLGPIWNGVHEFGPSSPDLSDLDPPRHADLIPYSSLLQLQCHRTAPREGNRQACTQKSPGTRWNYKSCSQKELHHSERPSSEDCTI